MFNYNSIKNILFSRGEIELKDKNKNIYKFSEIYIDEKKIKKIIGSDAKIFFNDDKMKEDTREIIPGYLQIVLQFPMRVHQFKKGFFYLLRF